MTTPMSEVPELKPCPFCGGENVSISYGRKANDMPFPYVECSDCTAMISGSEDTESSAVKAWNSRPREQSGGGAQKKNLQENIDEAYTLLGEANKSWAEMKEALEVAKNSLEWAKRWVTGNGILQLNNAIEVCEQALRSPSPQSKEMDEAKKLAILVLQSELYSKDMDVRDAVDNVIALSRQPQKEEPR